MEPRTRERPRQNRRTKKIVEDALSRLKEKREYPIVMLEGIKQPRIFRIVSFRTRHSMVMFGGNDFFYSERRAKDWLYDMEYRPLAYLGRNAGLWAWKGDIK